MPGARVAEGPGEITTAPYGVVRVAALRMAADEADQAAFRSAAAQLVDLLAEQGELREPVADALYASASGHDAAFHRAVVLPLRRDVHNGRAPRPALRAALADLPARVVGLERWLAVTDALAVVATALRDGTESALAADRRHLATACGSEALQRAVALTGADLLRAVQRAAELADRPDSRARKSEPNVLRYVARATTKTSPLSWFAAAGFGVWTDGPGDVVADPPTVAVAQPDRGAVEALVHALLDRPAGRFDHPHHLEPAARVHTDPAGGDQVRYRRPAQQGENGAPIRREAELALPLTGLLRYVVARLRREGSLTPRELAAEIATRLPGPPTAVERRATEYVGGLVAQGLLRPDYPLDTQALDALAAVTAAFPDLTPGDEPTGEPVGTPAAPTAEDTDPSAPTSAGSVGAVTGPAEAGQAATPAPDAPPASGADGPSTPADVPPAPGAGASAADAPTARRAGAPDPAAASSEVAAIAAATRAFPDVPAAKRSAALAELRQRWASVFAAVGTDPVQRRMPLTEDVVLRDPVVLGRRQGAAAHADLVALTPLFEVFDLFTVVRRAALDRFVNRYGPGAAGVDVGEFAAHYAEVWRDPALVGPGGIAATDPPGALGELAALRRDLATAAATAATRATAAAAHRPPLTVELDDELVATAARRLPAWVRGRAASFATFGQPLADGGLAVNRVYGGWGRFTSRFLPYWTPEAAEMVRRQIGSHLDDGRPAQIRPTGGFNGNLHPLLLDDEVGEAGRALHPDRLELAHDVAADQLRLRVRATGEPLDLFYLGFLIPVALPERLVPLLNDRGSGLVDVVSSLRFPVPMPGPAGEVSFRPRLRYGSVVLGRRRWRIERPAVEAWRAELDADPAAAVARWRAALGLPEQVFVAGAAAESRADLSALVDYLGAAKPQYADLGSALHQRCLSRTLARYPHGVVLEEALPAPSADAHVTEVITETYRRAS